MIREPRRVFLVGAGPGDPGLITVRGAEALRRADAVVYDHLADERLLRLAHEEAERIYVGKEAGRHSRPQEEINRLLVELHRAGKTVVRLKGGDPFVFGRGGEEALHLAREGIPFEVIPGITAGVGGLAHAGIPATHRGLAVTVTLATGHEDPAKGSPALDLEALARLGGTLVFYMAVKQLDRIVAGLLAGGLPEDTPAVVVRHATLPEQESVEGTLADIGERAKAAGIRPPAILVAGPVAGLRRELAWFEERPLLGRTVVVTRPRDQGGELAAALEARGARVLEHPAVVIEPAADAAPLEQALDRLHEAFDAVFFTSRNGVEHCFHGLEQRGRDARAFAGLIIAAVGPATAAALRAHGIVPDLVPEEHTGRGLARAFVGSVDRAATRRVLLPRSDLAPPDLPEALRRDGFEVEAIAAYRTVPRLEGAEALRAAIEGRRVDAVTFASGSAARGFVEGLGKTFLEHHRDGFLTVSIGPATSKVLRTLGLPPHGEAQEHTAVGLARAVEDLIGERQAEEGGDP